MKSNLVHLDTSISAIHDTPLIRHAPTPLNPELLKEDEHLKLGIKGIKEGAKALPIFLNFTPPELGSIFSRQFALHHSSLMLFSAML